MDLLLFIKYICMWIYLQWFFYDLIMMFFTLHSQAQMRDLTGFVETRQQLLTLKPNHRMNWIGFSVAHHLNSKYDLDLNWIFFFRNGDSHWPQIYFFHKLLLQVYVLDINNQCMQFIILSLFYFLFPLFLFVIGSCVSLWYEFFEVIFRFYRWLLRFAIIEIS